MRTAATAIGGGMNRVEGGRCLAGMRFGGTSANALVILKILARPPARCQWISQRTWQAHYLHVSPSGLSALRSDRPTERMAGCAFRGRSNQLFSRPLVRAGPGPQPSAPATGVFIPLSVVPRAGSMTTERAVRSAALSRKDDADNMANSVLVQRRVNKTVAIDHAP